MTASSKDVGDETGWFVGPHQRDRSVVRGDGDQHVGAAGRLVQEDVASSGVSTFTLPLMQSAISGALGSTSAGVHLRDPREQVVATRPRRAGCPAHADQRHIPGRQSAGGGIGRMNLIGSRPATLVDWLAVPMSDWLCSRWPGLVGQQGSSSGAATPPTRRFTPLGLPAMSSKPKPSMAATEFESRLGVCDGVGVRSARNAVKTALRTASAEDRRLRHPRTPPKRRTSGDVGRSRHSV